VIAAAREAIAENVQRRFPSMQVSPYILSQPTMPCAFIFPGPIRYDQAPGGMGAMNRGGDTWELTLRAMVGPYGDIAGQQLMDQLLEPSGVTSMKEALEQSATLGGIVFNIDATDCTGLRMYQPTPGSAPVMGADWTLKVFADGGGGP
jgi:hypothetical protein